MIELALYRLATRAAPPLGRLVLARRAARGKEDRQRLAERWGRASAARPPGRLVWLHAASVGESLSLLPLIERLLERLPLLNVLVTTATVSSAGIMAERLPARARHQYVPLDNPASVERFLDHWRPDLAVWVESELWPNLILATRRRGTPMALLNARMSEGSYRGWKRWPRLIAALLQSFDVVLGQDERQAERLAELGARDAATVGDLKAARPAPPADPAALAHWRRQLGHRPVWLAASTHAGEEEVVAEAHLGLKGRFPNLLTVLAPRHPARAEAVAALIEAKGVKLARHSRAQEGVEDAEVFLVDTLGELGLFYRLAPLVLVAGSLGAPGTVGGHNPLEAAQLGRAILLGPDTLNCAATATALDAAGGARRVADARSLTEAVAELLADPARCEAMGEAARAVAETGRGVVDRVLQRMAPLIDRLEPGAMPAEPVDGRARA